MVEFKKGDRVVYIPDHAKEDINAKCVQRGVVKRPCDDGDYFVLYDNLDMKMVTGDEPYTAQKTPFRNLYLEIQDSWSERRWWERT